MNEEKKKELFPFFAYLYSKKHKSNTYGGDISFEEWYKLIKDDSALLEEISSAASKLTDDEWAKVEEDYSKETSEEKVQSAKKGAKLNTLKKLRKMKKGSPKKCACGCDLISVKDKGGKIISKCTCGCKSK